MTKAAGFAGGLFRWRGVEMAAPADMCNYPTDRGDPAS